MRKFKNFPYFFTTHSPSILVFQNTLLRKNAVQTCPKKRTSWQYSKELLLLFFIFTLQKECRISIAKLCTMHLLYT